MKHFKVRLVNDDLVFSSAHFITYANGECESLHGHDFRVSVEVDAELDAEGQYVVDFLQLKKTVQEVLRKLDHKILLQEQNPHLTISMRETSPEDETSTDICSWVSQVGGWLSKTELPTGEGDSTEAMLAGERDLETHLSRELGMTPPPMADLPQSSNMMAPLHAEIEVRFQHRRWVFPEEDCEILPIVNTTAELLAEYIAEELLKKPILAGKAIQKLSVQIDESAGMAGIFEKTFPA